MSNVALIAVILRLVAIWLFVSILDTISWSHVSVVSQPNVAAWVLLKFLLAAWFFFWPLSVVRRLVPKEARRTDPVDALEVWTPDILQAVLFSAAGVWILVTTITSQGLVGAILYFATGDSGGLYVTGASFLVALIELAFGVWLLFGARGLFHLVSAARRARLDNKLFEDE